MKGKVTLINTLMGSLLQYSISCTPVPVRAVGEYKKMIVDFLWDSKRSKIAYNHLIQDIELGGLRLSDLETRIQVTHISLISKIANRPDSTQALILAEALGQEDISSIFASRMTWAERIDPRYGMLKEVLKTWKRWHNYEPNTEEMVQREIIWNNESILMAKKPFVWTIWRRAGISTINDLLHKEEARFLSLEELAGTFGISCTFLQAL